MRTLKIVGALAALAAAVAVGALVPLQPARGAAPRVVFGRYDIHEGNATGEQSILLDTSSGATWTIAWDGTYDSDGNQVLVWRRIGREQ